MNAIVMMPPYVAPEHRKMMDQAEEVLREYEDFLLGMIKKKFGEQSPNIEPAPDLLKVAERQFYEDPIRQQLVRNLTEVKLLCEKPRFLVKAT